MRNIAASACLCRCKPPSVQVRTAAERTAPQTPNRTTQQKVVLTTLSLPLSTGSAQTRNTDAGDKIRTSAPLRRANAWPGRRFQGGREGFSRVVNLAAAGAFSVLLVWKFDRLARQIVSTLSPPRTTCRRSSACSSGQRACQEGSSAQARAGAFGNVIRPLMSTRLIP